MSLESVKSVVARMHKDAEFKQKLASNRDETLAAYDLSSEELHAVVRLSVGGGNTVGDNSLWS